MRIQTMWILVQAEQSPAEMLTLEEYVSRSDSPKVFAVTRDMQEMFDLHAKYIGIAKRKRLSEAELDVLQKRLLREPKGTEELDEEAKAIFVQLRPKDL